MTNSASAPDPLVGTWKVVSLRFELEGSGERSDMYGQHPAGFVILTADGRMTAVITANERASDPHDALFDSMMAYSGRYRLQGNDSFVTQVDVAWHPAWVGTEQMRFFTRDGDTLSIMTALLQHPMFPGHRGRGVLVLRKE